MADLKAIVKDVFAQKYPEAAPFLIVETNPPTQAENADGLAVEVSLGEAGPETVIFPAKDLESEQAIKVSESFSDLLDIFKYLENNGFIYRYVIDLNERGEFRAHVEDPAGQSIYDIDNDGMNQEGPGGLWLVEEGFIKSIDDISGLEKYLHDMNIIPRSASLEAGA